MFEQYDVVRIIFTRTMAKTAFIGATALIMEVKHGVRRTYYLLDIDDQYHGWYPEELTLISSKKESDTNLILNILQEGFDE